MTIRDEIMEFQRTGCYDLMYMKTQPLRLERQPQDSKQWYWRQIRENCITKLYDWSNWPENLEVQPEEEADTEEKLKLQTEVEKAI